MSQASIHADIAIIGAGPVGLGLAAALAGSGLRLCLIDRQPASALSAPAFDGREIAITHATRALMQRYGLWSDIDQAEVSPLRDAKVMDGPALFALRIGAGSGDAGQLGYLVPNHLIRAAAWQAMCRNPEAVLLDGVSLASVSVGDGSVALGLSDGRSVSARLLVAADNRFSTTRRMLGIGASMHDFGRSMLVCRMSHEADHEHSAWEWFDYGQTLALLPLNGRQSGVVLTLPADRMQVLMSQDVALFDRAMAVRFSHRLGRMTLTSERQVYPLVGVYAHRFVTRRAALIGDAAVGMHPVTAHGFNFGLASVERLAGGVLAAHRSGADIGSVGVLQAYERTHRMATWPLYKATNLVATLYTDERLPALALRKAALHAAERMTPFKRLIAGRLTATA